MSTEMTEAEYNKRRTLRNISAAAENLRRSLEGVKRDVDRSLEQMDNANTVSGMWGQGPIGHQAPSDIVRYTTTLEMALEMARIAGATDEEIQEAYRVGSLSLEAAADYLLEKAIAQQAAKANA